MSELPAFLPRFSLSERIAHWLLAATFLLMLGSGAFMGGVGPLGHRAMLVIHLVSAGALVGGLVALSMRRSARRGLAGTAADLRRLTPADRRWLVSVPASVLGRGPLPRAGRFNAGQKLNSRLLALLLLLLYVSGFGELARYASQLGPLRPLAAFHGLAAGVMGGLVAAHAYMGALNPSTRPALRGMVRGTVSRRWAEEHHADWTQRLRESRERGDDA